MCLQSCRGAPSTFQIAAAAASPFIVTVIHTDLHSLEEKVFVPYPHFYFPAPDIIQCVKKKKKKMGRRWETVFGSFSYLKTTERFSFRPQEEFPEVWECELGSIIVHL